MKSGVGAAREASQTLVAASPTLGSSWPMPKLDVYAPADASSPVSSFFFDFGPRRPIPKPR
ncbi:hypothetical protein HanIR_Chr09g0411961 [Helianthus annuus]|nr:hypothetical protein HanIR_Chr09g0411961 [Helianthus annuus]